MPWKAYITSSKDWVSEPDQFGFNIQSFPSRVRSSGLPSYPDHWWSEDWWKELQNAGRHADEIAKIRLPDPNAPDSKETRAELDEILKHPTRGDFESRIKEIIEENAGPPSYYHRMLLTDAGRNIQTGALAHAAVIWSRPFFFYFKHKWKRPRPMQLEPRIRPVIDCPSHPAYPSGHSTQAHLIALVMGEVTGREDIKDALWTAADRIAQNREYAGVHYQSDSESGRELSKQIFPLFVADYKNAIDRAHVEEWG
jgi:hypothetical protein